jgi:mRNA interferase RelE/StbE
VPANYELIIARNAEKDLKRISQPNLKRIIDKIARLSVEPRPSDCVKLTGSPFYRIRQGDWRAIYEVDDERRMVTILKIAHRREAYR